VVLTLVIRGEAGSYFASFHENTAYSSYALTVTGWPAGVVGHLDVVRMNLPHLIRDLGVAMFAVLVASTVLSGAARQVIRSRLFVLTFVASLSTLLVLAETALWDHHLELLAFPVLCGGVLTLQCARAVARQSRWNPIELLVSGAVVSACLMVVSRSRHPLTNLSHWDKPPQKNVPQAIQRGAQMANFSGSGVSYMHLGANDEQGAGLFVRLKLRLACARFHQYPFTPPRELHETIQCLQRRAPQLLAVTPSFATDSGTPVAWHRFVYAGNAYVRSHCHLLVAQADVRVYRCRQAFAFMSAR